jgi:hypothetical protein
MTAQGNSADSQAQVCRKALDPDRKALRDLMRNCYTTSRMADNTRCPCGKRLVDCASTVYHA